MTWRQKLFVFLILTILIAPGEFHLDVWDDIRSNDSPILTAANAVLTTGLLWLYAIALACTTLYDITTSDRLRQRTYRFWLGVACCVPFAAWILEFFRVRYKEGASPDSQYIAFEVAATLIAVAVAILVRVILLRPNMAPTIPTSDRSEGAG